MKCNISDCLKNYSFIYRIMYCFIMSRLSFHCIFPSIYWIQIQSCIFMAHRASWSNGNCTNIIIYLLDNVCWYSTYGSWRILPALCNKAEWIPCGKYWHVSWLNLSKKHVIDPIVTYILRRNSHLKEFSERNLWKIGNQEENQDISNTSIWYKEFLEKNLGKKLDQERVKI